MDEGDNCRCRTLSVACVLAAHPAKPQVWTVLSHLSPSAWCLGWLSLILTFDASWSQGGCHCFRHGIPYHGV